MSKPLSLRVKLPVAILAVILLTLSVATLFIISTAEEVILYVKSNRVEDASLAVGNSIAVQLQRSGKDMVIVAAMPGVLEGVRLSADASKERADETAKRAELTALLQHIKTSFGYYDEFYLSNREGLPLAGSYRPGREQFPWSNQDWMDEVMAKGTFLVGEPYFDEQGSFLIPVALKLVYDGQAGALVGTVELSKITRGSIRESTRPGVTPYVVSSTGEVLSALSQNDVGSAAFGQEPWFPGIRDKVSGSLNIRLQSESKSIGFYHIPQTDLYSLVIADASYMSPYLNTIKNATIASGVITALLTVLCVGLFIFPVTRDIRRLSQFAGDITRGEDVSETGVKREDELGDLSLSLSKMVQTLKEMLQRAETATRTKSEFLARMSHEIRTPLNGIIGMTYLAIKNKPEPGQLEYLQRINNAAKTLLGIINDILDFSKMEANKMDLHNASFRLSDTLQSVYDLMLVKSQEKDLDLYFKVNEDVPDILRGDSLRLAQVLINLCTNALKFTDQGSVGLVVSLRNRTGKVIELQFAAHDTGIGISKSAQENIFDSFSQVDGSNSRQYGGTGLGLAISRLLVQMMGGEIWVESELGKGSTFYFTVRMQEGKPEELKSREADVPTLDDAVLPSLHVLLVEDNEINQEIAREILKDMGLEVVLAENGVEAVEMWDKENIDLILMDIQMPVMDGLAATQAIRSSSNPYAKGIPVIAMTANAMTGDKEKSLEAGMDEHITKPLDINELRRALIVWGMVAKTEKNKLNKKRQ